MEYKAFKDLTKEERSEIVEAKLRGEVEWFDWQFNVWSDSGEDLLVTSSTYRIKPAKKLDIPWEIIKPEYKWAAMEFNGNVFVSEEKPFLQRPDSTGWSCNSNWADISGVTVDTTGISWENSLIQRPEGI